MAKETLDDFGSVLKIAREQRGMTLRDVSRITKISMTVLEALESNDIDRVPAGVFGRSFVRAYATEVGLDPNETVEAFLDAFPEKRPGESRQSAEKAASEHFASDRRVAEVGKRLLMVSIPVALLLVVFGVWRGSGSGEDARVEPIVEAPAPASPAAAFSPPPRVSSADAPAVAEVAAVGPLTIEIHPTAACWVLLIIDGEEVLARVVRQGEREVHEAREGIVLNVGDAGAFDFSINQQPGRSLGDAGQVVNGIVINRGNYRSFITR
jgi:cytoskeletal protein RodZ